MKIVPSARFNRNASLSTTQIAIGRHKYNGGIVSITERNTFGVYLFAAITRYGKSTLVKNWYSKVAQNRPLVIFDYLGEHTFSKYPNFLSQDNNIVCVPDLIEIKDFKFKISQFNHPSDWISLTFTEQGAALMASLAKQYDSHRDDPKRFYDMLDDVPVVGQPWKIGEFENTWGFHLPVYQAAVLDGCKSRVTQLLLGNFFGGTEDFVYDFGKLALKHRYLNINFNLGKNDSAKGRAIAGKVLEQIKKVLDKFKIPPLFVIEEADVLAPEMEDSLFVPSSTLQLVDWVLKLQKKNIELAFIVQDPQRLNRNIVGNVHTFVFGQLPEKNEDTVLSRQLLWDIDRNYREFIIKSRGVPGYQVFIPFDSGTMY